MRLTRAQLLEAARREVERRAETNGCLAAYVIGSVVHDQAVLGGSADVDLVLIHESLPPYPREIVGLTDEVHLDIAHHDRQRYAQPRQLRLDPWLGPAIYDPLPLHDPQHLFEWAQASARGQFLRPDHRLGRARAFLERARALQATVDPDLRWVSRFARAALAGANAVATLAGRPAAGRRLLPLLENASLEAGAPEAYTGLLRLLGGETYAPDDLAAWVGAWGRAFDAASPLAAEPDLQAERRAYFLGAFHAQLDSPMPQAVVFHLIETWDRLLAILEAFDLAVEHRPAWEAATARLALDQESANRRLTELEAYLDHLEDFVDAWSARQGA